MSAVYIGTVRTLNGLRPGDDAKQAEAVQVDMLLSLDYAFDHRIIISDYLATRKATDNGEKEYASPKNFPKRADWDWSRSTCDIP